MKCVIAFSCLLAVASAGYINAPIAYAAYDDGSYRGEGLYEGAYKGEGILESRSQGYAYAAPYAVAAPIASEARLVDPVAIAAGAPLPTGDTYEVAAAKAAHFHAHAVAKSNHYGAAVVAPVVHNVAHAYAAPIASEARLVDPVAIAAGAPLPTGDTYEVAAAKAAHFHAHAVAKSNHYGAAVVGPVVHNVAHAYAAPYAHTYAAHTYAAHVPIASQARLVDPVAIAAGAPLPTGDTVEVAAAKAAHYRAHAAAKGHFIAKRSPVYLATAYSPYRSYGYSTIASPLAYSAYGYGRFGGYYL